MSDKFGVEFQMSERILILPKNHSFFLFGARNAEKSSAFGLF